MHRIAKNLLISLAIGFIPALYLKIHYNNTILPIYLIGVWFLAAAVLFFLLYAFGDLLKFISPKYDLKTTKKILSQLKSLEAVDLEIPIDKFSKVWTEEGQEIAIDMRKLAKNWRDEIAIKTEENYNRIENLKIKQFHDYLFNTLKRVKGETDYPNFIIERNIIQMLLLKLDMIDDSIPSVVDARNVYEPDSSKKQNNYALEIKANTAADVSSWEILRNVSLVEHTIHVAENAVALVLKKRKDDAIFYLLPAVIAALAHDLGKDPSERTADTKAHPVVSAEILERVINAAEIEIRKNIEEHGGDLEEFEKEKLSDEKKNALIEAVRNHHQKTIAKKETAGEFYLEILEILKEADHKARREEINEVGKLLGLTLGKTKQTGGGSDTKPEPEKENETVIKEADTKEDKTKTDTKEEPKQTEDMQDIVKKAFSATGLLGDLNDSGTKTEAKPKTGNKEIPPPEPYLPEFDEYKYYSLAKDIGKEDKENVEATDFEDYDKDEYSCSWLKDDTVIEDMLKIIESRINLVRKRSIRCVSPIFSVKDTVFMMTTTLLHLFIYFANRQQDNEALTILKSSRGFRYAVLLEMVEQFKKRGFIKEEDVKPKFFGGKFTLIKQDYNSDRTTEEDRFYTPFSLQAFADAFAGGDTEIYEKRKKDKRWDPCGILIRYRDYRWAGGGKNE